MRTFLALGVLPLLLSGCGRNLDEPPKVRLGEEVCAHCGMIISDQRFSCAITLKNGEVKKYDDFGCLLRDYDETEAHKVWVHKYDGEGWLDAKTAWFVQSKLIASPMASGIAALDSEEAARKLAGEVKGEVKRFDQLLGSKER